MYRLVIEEEAKTKKGKSKRFAGALLSYVVANALWDGGTSEPIRPIFMVLGGSEPALKPLVMNLRLGKKAVVEKMTESNWYSGRTKKTYLEVLKSAGYEVVWQRGENATVTIWQPDLFQANPGMIDPTTCKFVVLTPKWWVAQQGQWLAANPQEADRVVNHCIALGISKTREQLLEMLPQAARFCHYMDKRTKRPLLNDLAFSLQLYVYALKERIAILSSADGWFREFNSEAIGFVPGAAVRVTHEILDKWLANQVKLYRSVQGGSNG